MVNWISREKELKEREITIGQPLPQKFAPNVIKNQKYNIITFFPLVLFQQFKFFLNLYFLVMACSQFFKVRLKISLINDSKNIFGFFKGELNFYFFIPTSLRISLLDIGTRIGVGY